MADLTRILQRLTSTGQRGFEDISRGVIPGPMRTRNYESLVENAPWQPGAADLVATWGFRPAQLREARLNPRPELQDYNAVSTELDRFLRSNQSPVPLSTYRGMHHRRFDLDNAQPGDYFDSLMPVSTSFDPNIGVRFSGMMDEVPGWRPSMFRIDIPRGGEGFPNPSVMDEQEWLLPGRSRFELMERRPDTYLTGPQNTPTGSEPLRLGVLRALREGEIPRGAFRGSIAGGAGVLPLLMEDE